uniref:Lecithin retinol acyltransferase n=1 Tax=Candidatus Kentrum sp. TUN TaxID=2126343 RepID=A0A450ZC74_9GAMM|nr:MAG: Lecithin retinol acyltransferase [Candidatus Kentron sp. TUN]VFK51389.1 MAG: Lecithin retinol acyltransferase [Candidatus Kentron sp. TUN]VFK58042.1 MAG: Lecithin retinol acyltransferase [Candidatus Kentron sp. TUN]
MPKGDHLIVYRGTYLHHGLDLGDGLVMQYGSKAGETNARVEIVRREMFSQGNLVKVLDKPAAYSPSEIIERANRRLGEQNYSLISGNCEHFVNWCRTGESKSWQVDWVCEKTVSSATKLAANYAARTVVKSSTKATVKTMTRGVTPWLLVADGAQLATEFVTTQMGVREEKAETAGQIVGVGTSVGIGTAMGGPIGALVGVGLWAVGEVVGKRISSYLLRGLEGSASTLSTTTQNTEEIPPVGCNDTDRLPDKF